ncbi:Succinate dehydrogenase cytochrome B subunit mitochondrial [Ranunculus cassubicifolius]
MASLILKRRSSDMKKFLFQNPLIRSAQIASPPSDCLLPGIRRFSDIAQTRSLSPMMDGLIKSNPITNNTTSQVTNGIHTMTNMPVGLGMAGKVAASSGGRAAIRNYSTQSVRPLSPHLAVYKPQSTSIASILHRIAFMYLAGVITFYYLLYIKMGMIAQTFGGFNLALFYTAKLDSLLAELSGVAVIYYFYHEFHDIWQFRKGGIKTGLLKLLRMKK